MDRNLIKDSAWKVVLHDGDLATIGAICTLWAFIEMQIDMMLERLHDLEPRQFKELTGDKQIGSKIDMLKVAADRADDPLITAELKIVCDHLKPAAADRNQAVHGRWGAHITRTKQGALRRSPEPMAQSAKGRQPLPAARLAEVLKTTAELTARVEDIALVVIPELQTAPRPHGGRGYSFGQILPEGVKVARGEDIVVEFE